MKYGALPWFLVGATTAAGCMEPAVEPEIDRREDGIISGVLESNHAYVVGVGGSSRAFCTGTVISRRTVLTAGHCIGGVRNIFLGPSINNGAATKIPVLEEILHPDYRDLPNDNATYDLGILRLGADAPVQAAPLFRDILTNEPRFIGPSFVFVGYGATSGFGGGFGTKRATTFPIHVVGPAVVGNSFPAPDNLPAELFYYVNTETGSRATCSGDSGGPAFFVEGGVEWLAGVTSAGDERCVVDGSNQRSDQPYIDDFIQPYIDELEGDDPCRSNGVCDESCTTAGAVGDPDCAAAHCGVDGVCAEACAAPIDPDCVAAGDDCADNGRCDPSCAPVDPDCARQCGAEGNCLPDCATPDPDCLDLEPPDDPQGDDPQDDLALADDSEAGGCGCRTHPQGVSGFAPGLIAMALVARRRRSAARRR